MNFIKPLQSKEIKENGQKAKFIFFGFVLILALVYFMMGAVKVSAVTTAEITGTSYNKNGSTIEDFDKKDLVNGSDTLTFIQGNGEDSKVAINFTINDFPSNATSFMIVESERSDSMGENADADRYSKGDDFEWHPSSSNKTL